jgi:hypothetical protein
MESISCHSEDDEGGRRIPLHIGTLSMFKNKRRIYNTETGFFASIRMTVDSDGILRFTQNDTEIYFLGYVYFY